VPATRRERDRSAVIGNESRRGLQFPVEPVADASAPSVPGREQRAAMLASAAAKRGLHDAGKGHASGKAGSASRHRAENSGFGPKSEPTSRLRR